MKSKMRYTIQISNRVGQVNGYISPFCCNCKHTGQLQNPSVEVCNMSMCYSFRAIVSKAITVNTLPLYLYAPLIGLGIP